MKKLLTSLTLCLLLMGVMLPLGAAAETPEEVTGIDQNLVIHYDFEGETLEEQLSDKAPAGVSKENLSLFSTNDENTGAPLTYISDGVAHIDHALNNYLYVPFDAENNIGTDVLNCAEPGEMTIFTAVRVIGSPQAWATFVDFNNVVRMYLCGSAGNTAIFSTLGIRGTTTMNDNANVDFAMKNADIYHETDVVYIAVTYQYDASAKKLVGAAYLSFDYGETYTETLGLFEEVEEFITQCGHICFGKTRAGNQFKRTDHGSSYDFYDFRVYNTALTPDEIKSIRTGDEPEDLPDLEPGDDSSEDETSGAGDEPTREPGTTEGGTPTREPSPTDDSSNSDTGSDASDPSDGGDGCASMLSFGGLSAMALIAIGALGLVRKKD